MAKDPISGLLLQVECDNFCDDAPWVWFVADGWPSFPGGNKNLSNEYPAGRAATELDAKEDAEDALPTKEEMEEITKEAEQEWDAYYKAKTDAAPNN